MKIKNNTDWEITWEVNLNYLTDTLNAVSDDRVTMRLKDAESLFIIVENREGIKRTHLVMPMRLE